MFYIKNFIYLLIISTCLYTQDHQVYWEINTAPVDDNGFTDEHIEDFVEYHYGNACVENTDEGYYVCIAKINEDACESNSNDDMAIIKYTYEGEEFDRDYICDFYQAVTQDDQPFGIAYANNGLYIMFYGQVPNGQTQDLEEWGVDDGGTHDWLARISLDSTIEWIRKFDYCNLPNGSTDTQYCGDVEPKKIDVDSEGNVVIFGDVYVDDWFGLASSQGTYLSKYDLNGNPVFFSLNHLSYQYISNFERFGVILRVQRVIWGHFEA